MNQLGLIEECLTENDLQSDERNFSCPKNSHSIHTPPDDLHGFSVFIATIFIAFLWFYNEGQLCPFRVPNCRLHFCCRRDPLSQTDSGSGKSILEFLTMPHVKEFFCREPRSTVPTLKIPRFSQTENVRKTPLHWPWPKFSVNLITRVRTADTSAPSAVAVLENGGRRGATAILRVTWVRGQKYPQNEP